MLMQSQTRNIPLAVKLVYLLWMVIWVPVYWVFNGPENFLWLCDLANIILLFALCLESSLLMSSQAAGVLLIQLVWVLDFLSAWLLGSHLTGGTEYMFDPALNINWVWQPFGLPQSLLSPHAFVLFMMLAYPLLLVFPTHLLLSHWFRPVDGSK